MELRVTDLAPQGGSLSDRTLSVARDVLAGNGRGWWRYSAFVGPAVVVSVAYIDPGNFATNIQAGAKYGYGLLWVVLLANLIAMLFQGLSAKLGIVTGHNLAEMCREHFPRWLVWAMWVVSEIAAMATDLAEFLGGAIGLSLLLGIPLLAGMVVTGIIVYASSNCTRGSPTVFSWTLAISLSTEYCTIFFYQPSAQAPTRAPVG